MLGVVACESLYSELDALVPDADVRYVPAELHEFPVNVPNQAAIADHVQRRVDELDRPDVDRILVLYANSGGGLRGVSAERTPLFVSRADDCISLFTHRVEPWTMGEPKEFGTYYLTRGWIDAGVDSYKLYRAYRGEEADLLDWFDRAASRHPDLRVTWPDGDRYAAALERGYELSPDLVGRFFHEVVQYYERVKLVDTGRLYEFHHEYAATVRSFVEELSAEHGDGHAVDLQVVDGDRSLLASFLDTAADGPKRLEATDDGPEYLDRYPPGTPVE